MKIAVCMKRVPDTAARIKIDPSGRRIDHGGVEYCISPYDEIAIERAVALREAGAAEEVVLFCLGVAESTKEIRTALAMGATRAVHLVADPDAYDSAATAAALAAAIQSEGPPGDGGCALLLFGNKAADTDAGQVGARVAALLGVPFVNQVSGLEVEGTTATIVVAVEGASETLRSTLPVAIGAQKGLAEPRYPALKGIMAAKKKPIDTQEAPPAANQLDVNQLSLPPERAAGTIVGEGVAAVPELVRLLREQAKVI